MIHVKNKLVTHARALLVRGKTHLMQDFATQVRQPVLVDQQGVNEGGVFQCVSIGSIWCSKLQIT